MKPPAHVPSGCRPIVEILSRIGDKWSLLVVRELGDRTMRFSELKRAIEGISQKMLTSTLRGLEYDGLVERTVHPTVPPRVEYALTPLGRDLEGPVSALSDWAQRHRGEIEAARERFKAAESDDAAGAHRAA